MSIDATTGNVPGTDPRVLKAAEVNLVRTGHQNAANLQALIHPPNSALRSAGTGIHVDHKS